MNRIGACLYLSRGADVVFAEVQWGGGGGVRVSRFLECHHLQTGVAYLLYLITNLEL